MNTTTITPPIYKTLFPLGPNEKMVDDLAKEHNLFVFPEYNLILFVGISSETDKIKNILVDGVTG